MVLVYASELDEITHLTIERWKRTANSQVDDIEAWRDATDAPDADAIEIGRRRVKGGCGRWGPPKDFWGHTHHLVGILMADFPKLDPQPILNIQDAVTAWHTDRNAKRIPPQPQLWDTAYKAVMIVNAVETAILRRMKDVHSVPPLPEADEWEKTAQRAIDNLPLLELADTIGYIPPAVRFRELARVLSKWCEVQRIDHQAIGELTSELIHPPRAPTPIPPRYAQKVNELWNRSRLVLQVMRKAAEPAGEADHTEGNKEQTDAKPTWYHLPADQKPENCSLGPITGSRKELNYCLCGKEDRNYHALIRAGNEQRVWIIEQTPRSMTMYFYAYKQHDYNDAVGRQAHWRKKHPKKQPPRPTVKRRSHTSHR